MKSIYEWAEVVIRNDNVVINYKLMDVLMVGSITCEDSIRRWYSNDIRRLACSLLKIPSKHIAEVEIIRI